MHVLGSWTFLIVFLDFTSLENGSICPSALSVCTGNASWGLTCVSLYFRADWVPWRTVRFYRYANSSSFFPCRNELILCLLTCKWFTYSSSLTNIYRLVSFFISTICIFMLLTNFQWLREHISLARLSLLIKKTCYNLVNFLNPIFSGANKSVTS